MSGKKNGRPNILLLFSDQHNRRALGCYGDKRVHTPNLDKLVRQGVRFTNAVAQNTICTPSRMCYMSGQYVHNFGYYGLMGRKPENLPNIFQYLKRFGYKTGMAGKIHTPAGWLSEHCDFVADGYGCETPLKKGRSSRFESTKGAPGDEYELYLSEKGLADKRDDIVIPELRGRRGYQGGQGLDARPSELPLDDTFEAWTAKRTIDFLDQAHEEKVPFCFWMTVARPHETYLAAKEFWDMYDEKKLTLPPNSEDDMSLRHPNTRRMHENFKNSKDWRIYKPDDWDSVRKRILHGYYACVTQVDDAVGRVLKKLDKLGMRENTIIVYATDHGEFAGEHGMIEKAPGIGFGCVTRIPYIWSWPGHIPEHVVRDALVETVDFLPTVCSLAGLPAPNWTDGFDITGVLEKGADVREIAVTENPLSKTVMTKKFKLTQYPPEMCDGADFGELFDLKDDPWELNNLYRDPAHKEIIHDLRYKLYLWLIRTTRHVTVSPSALGHDGKSWINWELADICDDDNKVGRDLIKRLIDYPWLNYL